MVIITKESSATRVFAAYRNVAAFTLGKSKGYVDEVIEIGYKKLDFLPDEDTVNAVKNGDIKMKKVIRAATKAITNPSMKSAGVGLGISQIISMATSNRKSKRGPSVLVFVRDEEDPARDKILVKYLTAIFAAFGITPITKNKEIKKIFYMPKKTTEKKLKKAAQENASTVTRYQAKHANCRLNKKGAALKEQLQVFYSLELHQSAMNGLGVKDLDEDAARTVAKALTMAYTAENLKRINSSKVAKRLAKKDKDAVKAYKTLRRILKTMDPNLKLPKAEFGQKKKHGRAVGPKMNDKKFISFYRKRKNRSLLILIYGHTLARLLGLEIGTKEYNAHMSKNVCANFDEAFTKAFIAASNQYAKSLTKTVAA